MKSILKEPLLHFLLIGALLFTLYSLMAKPNNAERGDILITQGQIAAIEAGFSKTWQRPPTASELDGLIRRQVREEVYAREAIALGLDRDDVIIRRRLQQKLEFIANDLVVESVNEATDAELNAYLQAHPDAFRQEARFSLRQVFLNPDKHPASLERDAQQLLAQLSDANAKIDPARMGDATMLEHALVALPRSDLGKMLGEEFAAQVEKLPLGQWQGPITSSFGLHLVMISERSEGQVPPLAQVRDTVVREWANAQRVHANEGFYQTLLKRYSVTIENRTLTLENTAVPTQ